MRASREEFAEAGHRCTGPEGSVYRDRWASQSSWGLGLIGFRFGQLHQLQSPHFGFPRLVRDLLQKGSDSERGRDGALRRCQIIRCEPVSPRAGLALYIADEVVACLGELRSQPSEIWHVWHRSVLKHPLLTQRRTAKERRRCTVAIPTYFVEDVSAWIHNDIGSAVFGKVKRHSLCQISRTELFFVRAQGRLDPVFPKIEALPCR